MNGGKGGGAKAPPGVTTLEFKYTNTYTRDLIASGTAVGEPECSSQSNGQFQCIVNVSGGGQIYLLVGGPGALPGRVWYLASYHPDS